MTAKLPKPFITLMLSYVCLMFVCVFAASTKLGNELFGLLAAATAVSIFQLVGIWSAFGTGPYWRRSLLAVACGLVIAIGGLLGNLLASLISGTGLQLILQDFFDSDLFPIYTTIPIFFALVQIPSWMLRLVFGWRIARLDNEHDPPRDPISIADLMTYTTFVAIGIAGLQLGQRLATDAESVTAIPAFAVIRFSLFLIGPYLVLFLPCLMMALSKKANYGKRFVQWIGGFTILFFVSIGILSFLVPPVTSQIRFELGILATMIISFTYPLIVLREMGFVLERQRVR